MYDYKEEFRKKREYERSCHEYKDDEDFLEGYASACIDSAEKAVKACLASLEEDNHSGFSYDITVNMVVSALLGVPLTAEDPEGLGWMKAKRRYLERCRPLIEEWYKEEEEKE